jgi:predicted DNA-binding ribbon-helix-helix protein
MRTTLNIEDDVLTTVKELAQKEQLSTGKILSRLAREALTNRVPQPGQESRTNVAGFQPFPARDKVVCNEHIDRLRDDEGV